MMLPNPPGWLCRIQDGTSKVLVGKAAAASPKTEASTMNQKLSSAPSKVPLGKSPSPTGSTKPKSFENRGAKYVKIRGPTCQKCYALSASVWFFYKGDMHAIDPSSHWKGIVMSAHHFLEFVSFLRWQSTCAAFDIPDTVKV
jgi:hypothetical protein